MMKIVWLYLLLVGPDCAWGQQVEPYEDRINEIKVQIGYQRFSDKKQAEQLLSKGLKLALEEDNELDIGFFYRKLIAQKGTSAELDSARYFFQKGVLYYWATRKKKGEGNMVDKGLLAHLNSELAEAFGNNRDLTRALQYYHRADSLYHRIGDYIGEGISKLNIGENLLARGEYSGALARFLEAKDIFDTTGFHYIKANVYADLSQANLKLGNLEKAHTSAVQYLEEALKEPYGQEEVIKAHIQLADIYWRRRDKMHVNEELKAAMRLIVTHDLRYFRLAHAIRQAAVWLEESRSTEALELLNRNAHLLQEFRYGARDHFDFHFMRAKCLIRNKRSNEAIALLEQISREADELGVVSEQAEIARMLSELYAGQGNFEKAYDLSVKYTGLYKQLLGLEKQKEFKVIEEKYQAQVRKNELLRQKSLLAQKDRRLLKSELESGRKGMFLMFASIGVIILAVIIFYIVKLNAHRKRRLIHEKELQAREDKLRISMDLHDHIGAGLTLMKSKIEQRVDASGDVQEREVLSEIGKYTTEAIRQLRSTIWATRHDHVHLSDFEMQIDEFLQRSPIACVFEADYAEDIELSSLIALNLFRVLQEAVQNAVKYSKGSLIEVQLVAGKGVLELRVRDNGVGFDSSGSRDGHGLTNMEARVSALGGKCTIESGAEGTEVCVTLEV